MHEVTEGTGFLLPQRGVMLVQGITYMITTRTKGNVPVSGRRCLLEVITILFCLLLLSCSSTGDKEKSKMPESERYALSAIEARKTGPLEGDVCVIDGLEYVWTKNSRYMTTPTEPMFVWAPRYLYTPSYLDTFSGQIGYPVKKTKEMIELEERLARLEAAVRGQSTAPAPREDQPITDETGRTWTLYFRNDDGVKWYLDQNSFEPSRTLIQMWRKRVFPQWAKQKEIVTLDEINCRQTRFRTLQLRVTHWDGRTQMSDKVTPWAKIYSSSAEEYLTGEYCK